MTFYDIIMKIIKNCVAISFLLVILTGCDFKIPPSSPSSSNSQGSGLPSLTPEELRQKSISDSVIVDDPSKIEALTIEEIENFKTLDGNLFAMSTSSPKVLKKLIEKVGNIKAKEMILHKEGSGILAFSALDKAIESDSEESLEIFLNICTPDEANLKQNIFKAVHYDSIKVFKALSRKYPDLLTKRSVVGETLLQVASRLESLKISNFLINNKD